MYCSHRTIECFSNTDSNILMPYTERSVNAQHKKIPKLSTRKDDVAIIGISCRYPGGVHNPQQFFQFLIDGGNGIIDVPKDRWDNNAYFDPDREKPNRMYVNRGGFLSEIDMFDPLFFGISPKEAQCIDPQHRWLLEITYEAFENAGIVPAKIRGSNTAVFMGQFMHDYEQILMDSNAHKLISSHSATGSSMTLTANRISYLFDLIGPSVTLDTACSSSLVALDLACRSIRLGDSDMAIAGGVNILLRPEATMAISAASMLSPDCLCKSFDASANGYVRSEGAGVVVVKNLEKALQDNDPILAVIKATGTNQDGQTQGITVPNGSSQKKLLEASLKNAGISAADIQYAEAHGTGTSVGDPIEVNALGELLGERHKDAAPCIIGSVKSNLGHMESAAGMAGLMKAVLAMNHGVIPKNIHYETTNPAIDLAKLNLRILKEPEPWPDSGKQPRRAIVNSFGFGGTNANAVLEQAPATPLKNKTRAPTINHGKYLLVLSAKSQSALQDTAANYQAYFDSIRDSTDTQMIHDICYTTSIRREHFKHRLAVSGQHAFEFSDLLKNYLSGVTSSDIHSGEPFIEIPQGTCFVFSGMGTQWAGAGRELYASEPVYQNALDKCDTALKAYSGWSLVEVLCGKTQVDIHQTDIAQPVIFATQVALFELITSWGIQPNCMVGHSAGEVAAAYCAGVYSFEDAIKIIHHRSHLQQTTSGMGKMLAVGVTEADLPSVLRGYEDCVSVAAINSEDAITIAGDEKALQAISDKLDNEGVFTRFLKVSVPFHSPVMDQLKKPLIEALQGITVNAAAIPLYSTVTGTRVADGTWGPSYWADNLREPVKFKAAIEEIAKMEVSAFLELAPHTALATSITKTLNGVNKKAACVITMKRDQCALTMMHQMLAQFHISGHTVDWNALYPNLGEVVSLPNYPWQKASYWREADEVRHARIINAPYRSAFKEKSHPLLGSKLESADQLWQNPLDVNELTYIAGHKVGSDIIYPGAGYIEMALGIACQTLQTQSDKIISLDNISFHRALYLTTDEEALLETTYNEEHQIFTIRVFDKNTGNWNLHSRGHIRISSRPLQQKRLDLEKLKNTFPDTMNHVEFYEITSGFGLSYEGEFKPLKCAWIKGRDALARIRVSDEIFADFEKYQIHPALLDGTFQTFFATTDTGYLPVKINTLHYYEQPGQEVYCLFETLEITPTYGRGNLTICNDQGRILIEILDFEVNAIIHEDQNIESDKNLAYDLAWEADRSDEREIVTAPPKSWLLLTRHGKECNTLIRGLSQQQQDISIVELSDVDCVLGTGRTSVNLNSPDALNSVFAKHAGSCKGIIYLPGGDANLINAMDGQAIFNECTTLAMQITYIAQAYEKAEWRHNPEIVYLTQNAQHIQGKSHCINPIHGSLWGFARVQASEYPGVSIRLIDFEVDSKQDDLLKLSTELDAAIYEQEVAFRGGQRFVNRLRRLSQNEFTEYTLKEREFTRNDFYELCLDKNRQHLHLLPGKTNTPKGSELLVKVEGSYVETHDSLAGSEGNAQNPCFISVGTVAAIGDQINGISPGDRVLVVNHAHLESQILCDGLSVFPLDISNSPLKQLSHAVTHLRADYLFYAMADLPDHATMYVHDAASDQGRAFIDVALQRNLKIVAGVTSYNEIALLESISISGIVCTEDLDYQRKLKSIIGSNGFDIIISDHCGAYPTDIAAIASGFCTLVRLSSTNNTHVKLPASVSEISLTITGLLNYRYELCVKLLSKQVVCCDTSTAVPYTPAYPADTLAEQLGNLTGKAAKLPCILDFSAPRARGIEGLNTEIVKTDRTYLVTGGLGGLGLQIMHWLAEQGAKSIALIGRREPSDPALQQINSVRSKNVTVTTLKADVTLYSDVERVVEEIDDKLMPLVGIIHSAGVLDDGVISQQTEEKFGKVLSPKVLGTCNLHRATQALPIDLFVCFSSIASIVGWAGQANYATGNAFMDSFSYYRASQGLPCLTINWGPWAEAGMAANLEDIDIKRMNDAGMYALSPEKGLLSMHELLQYRVIQSGVFDLDWKRIGHQFPTPERKTLFKNFLATSTSSGESQFSEQLAVASDDIRETLLVNKIAELLSEILGIDDPNMLSRSANLFDYGVNSLMAMDFKNRLALALKSKLPASLLPKNPTIDGMVYFLLSSGNLSFESAKEESTSEAALYIGEGQMLIPQRYFFRRVKDPAWGFNCHYFETDEVYDIQKLEIALRRVVEHHDALRARFKEVNGVWSQEFVALTDTPLVYTHNWSHIVTNDQIRDSLGEFCDDFVKKVKLDKDSLIRIDIFERGDNRERVVLFSMHHLCFDGISKAYILEDLQSAYSQLMKGLEVRLPPKSVPIYEFANGFEKYINTEEITKEVDYWTSLPWDKLQPLAFDNPDDGTRGYVSTESSIHAQLTERQTKALLKKATSKLGCQEMDIFTAAYAILARRWLGSNHVVFRIMDSCRNIFTNWDDLDISRTVGWIAVLNTTLVSLPETADVHEIITSVSKQRDRIPNKGLLPVFIEEFHHDPSIVDRISKIPEANVWINYFPNPTEHSNRPIHEVEQHTYLNPENIPDWKLILVINTDGKELKTEWHYSTDLFTETTINWISDTYIQVLAEIATSVTNTSRSLEKSDA